MIETRRALLLLAAMVAVLLALVVAKPSQAESPYFTSVPSGPFSVGAKPTTVTNADFDEDGNLDLAVSNQDSNSVSVLLGNGDGTFRAKQDYGTGFGPSSVSAADFNEDGNLDLAVSNQDSNSVSVLLGNGDGTFRAKQDYGTGFGPSSVSAADFNEDGNLDLAVSNQGASTLTILRGNGDGTFQPKGTAAQDLNTGTAPIQVITADFNEDGNTDFATADAGRCDNYPTCTSTFLVNGGFSVRLGNGDGTFRGGLTSESGIVPSIATADFNGDGNLDIAQPLYRSKAIRVTFGRGDDGSHPFLYPETSSGAATHSVQTKLNANPYAITAADFDADSNPDLAITNYASNNLSVLMGHGDGTFQFAGDVPVGGAPISVTGAPFDDHGYNDLAVANHNANDVSVLLNNPLPSTSIDSGPTGAVTSRSASFRFSSGTGSDFECRLDNAQFASCTSPVSYSDLAEGSHTFEVRVINADGISDPTPARRSWTVDNTPPNTTIGSTRPANPTNKTDATFNFASTEANSTFQCQLDNGGFSDCSRGDKNYSSLQDGSHTFEVKATDAAGNVDASPASYTWTIDTRPLAELDQSQTTSNVSVVNTATHTYQTFTAAKTGRLDKVSVYLGCCFELYTDAYAHEGHPPIIVSVEGGEGFVHPGGDIPVNLFTPRLYWIDVHIDPAPWVVAGEQYQLQLSVLDRDYDCQTVCPYIGAATSDVYPGGELHIGFSGNNWQTSSAFPDMAFKTYVTPPPLANAPDGTPPETIIDVGPSGPVNTIDNTFEFSSSESGSRFLCKIDGGLWSICSSPQQFGFVGTHTFQVKAIDPSGGVDPTPASRTWTVDDKPPTLSALPDITEEATGHDGAAVPFDATATDAVDPNPAVSCTKEVDPAVPVSSGDTFPLGTTTVTCTATDGADNKATDSFDVTVQDTTGPQFSINDDNITATTSSGATHLDYNITAWDVVDGEMGAECSPAPGTAVEVPLGTTTQIDCFATDAAGNVGYVTWTLTALYRWSGILQPINADGSSIFKLGSTVPIKFALTAGSAGITDAAATFHYSKVDNTIEGTVMEGASTATPTSGNLFHYDAKSEQYIFNWNTKGLTAGTYELTIDLGDGWSREMVISLKK